MLADTPNVDGSTSANRSQPEDLLVRRIGLEQEFFLVDRRGMLSDLADPFLSQCQQAAQTEGLDPHCFKAEYDRFSHAGRCAGAHLHLELPAGTVWPDVRAALDAPLAAQDARILPSTE